MRKSTAEKIKIVEEATSYTKIKKLAIQHAITTKTIRRWIKQYNNGEFLKEEQKKPRVKKVTLKKVKPFQNIVFNIIQMKTPYKGNGKNGFYRFQIKDMYYGFIFAGYSTISDRKTVGCFLTKFIETLSELGYSVKRIVTAKTVHLNGVEKILSDHNIKHEFAEYKDIKKYISFSLKKNSYMNEKTLYETKDEFLFDSLSTTAKNNELVCENFNILSKKIKGVVKEFNYKLHTAKNKKNDGSIYLNEDFLSKQYDKAVEFHKKIEYNNADFIYEKLYYILKDTNYFQELCLKVLMQRGKVFGLRKEFKESDKFLKNALNITSKIDNDKQLEYERLIYLLYADYYRMELNKKKSIFYMRKVELLVNRINNPEKTATFYINYSRLISNFNESKKSMEYLEISKKIAEENELIQLIPQIQESIANNYTQTMKYDEAKRIYQKIIDKDFYAKAPYHKALLFAKFADIHNLTGDLTKSIELYDESLQILNKHKAIKAYLQLIVIIMINKAYTLEKKNSYEDAKLIYVEYLRITKENNFVKQIFHIISNLIFVLINLEEIRETKKLLKEFKVLLNNEDNPEAKYKYYLANSMINKFVNQYSKAEKNIIEAVKISLKSNLYKKESYFACKFELIDLYIDMKKLDKAEKLAEETYWETRKTKLKAMRYKAKMLKTKVGIFKRHKDNREAIGVHITHLHHLVGKRPYTEEEFYMIRKEFYKYIKQIDTKECRPSFCTMREDYYGLKTTSTI